LNSDLSEVREAESPRQREQQVQKSWGRNMLMELPTVVKGRAQDRGSRAVSCVTLEARNSHSVAFVSSFKWARKHVTGGYEDGKEEGWGGVSCTRQHTNILQVCTGWVKPAKGPVPWRSGGMALATRQEQLFKKKKKNLLFSTTFLSDLCARCHRP
jgi:hypothetical protein